MQKSFKNIFLAVLFSFYFLAANAQFATIPDTNFVNWLNSNGYASCMNGNLMDTTCSIITNATSLNCYTANFISDLTGVQYFDNLQTLNCYNIDLTYLPTLPSSLTALRCSDNLLTSLPPLPPGLQIFIISGNPISSLPVLPSTLQQLHCTYTPLTALPTLPQALTHLICYNSQISSLPTLPSSLIELLCNGNPLPALPNLPSSLQYIHCDETQLTSLPSLPSSLLELNCSYNQITILPTLPLSLQNLNCSYNQIVNLPNLPPSLYKLFAQFNLLSSIPSLPDSMFQLFIYNNSNISCLPRLKRIVNFNFSNTNVQCLPNYGTVTSSNPVISTLPLCDLFNTNNCVAYWNISGKVYADPNNNCISDNNELHLPNMKLVLDSSGTIIQQAYTGGEGLYSFETDTGTYTYTVDTTDLPLVVTCPVSSFQSSFITPVDSMDYDMDFGVQCKPGFDLGVTSVMRDSGIFRPANFSRMKISAGDISNFYGLHCAAGISGSVNIIFNGAVSYISPSVGALTPILSGDTLIYAISDFGNVNFDSDFRFVMQADTSAVLGSSICFDVMVSPSSTDIKPLNNILNHCFTVINSFDPNTKEVYPVGIIDTSQNWLTYTINFQNTGTASAQHIYILDSLDSNLDASSFELLSYSHMPLTQIVGNVVRFNFPNIDLPDSISDEPNSHGYVQYRIKINPGTSIGTTINNSANIFFDFNSPISTNTVTNQIQITTGNNVLTYNKEINFFPNPVKNILYININQNDYEQTEIIIYDIFSKIHFHQRFTNNTTLDLGHLARGIYFYEVRDRKGLSKKGKILKD